MAQILKHAAVILTVLLAGLGIPYAFFAGSGTLGGSGLDAVSGATPVVPDQPSGIFFVLLNTDRHPGTAEDWARFFSEQEVDVIMEDIHCFVPFGDAAGAELADRYRIRLAENQMEVTGEDGTLIVSRAEHGLFDAIVLSADAASFFDYSEVFKRNDVMVIRIGSEP